MTIETELRQLLDEDPEDILHPEVVHNWARDHPDSFLYGSLEWDDAKAGYEYRLIQIRGLIRLHIVDAHKDPQVISLRIDRVAGGGYRRIEDVMEAPHLAQMALQEALDDLQRVLRRYEHLTQLAGVRAALDELIGESRQDQHPQHQRVVAVAPAPPTAMGWHKGAVQVRVYCQLTIVSQAAILSIYTYRSRRRLMLRRNCARWTLPISSNTYSEVVTLTVRAQEAYAFLAKSYDHWISVGRAIYAFKQQLDLEIRTTTPTIRASVGKTAWGPIWASTRIARWRLIRLVLDAEKAAEVSWLRAKVMGSN